MQTGSVTPKLRPKSRRMVQRSALAPAAWAVYIVPAVFALCMLLATVPELINEPYPRVAVGVTIDSGSRLFTLLGPVAAWFFIIFGILGLVFYLAFQKLRESIQHSGALSKLLGTSD